MAKGCAWSEADQPKLVQSLESLSNNARADGNGLSYLRQPAGYPRQAPPPVSD
jgi:hypothetical protein